jgi:rhodanese-related sulfurtransferase
MPQKKWLCEAQPLFCTQSPFLHPVTFFRIFVDNFVDWWYNRSKDLTRRTSMKIYISFFLSLLICLLTGALLGGCRTAPASAGGYEQITAEEAKNLMDTKTNFVILDVRTEQEYDLGHIPGAIVIPNEVILEEAEGTLTDKNQLILVYCRSGRRSKEASQKLVDLGYTNVKEFGGIIDWPYQTTR